MEKIKKILFLGGMFPKDSELIIKKSRGNIQNAANVFQWNVIEGITKNIGDDTELTLASAPFVGSWPTQYRELFINSKNIESNNYNVDYISFINLPFLKNISRYFACKKYVTQWIKKNENYDNYIIAYSAHTPFVRVLNVTKKKYEYTTHLIVPDLPQYMVFSKKKKIVYSFLKRYDISVLYNNLVGIDSFTFLTDQMASKMNIHKRPYVVIEGMINKMEANYYRTIGKNGGKKTVVYAGGLEESYGVKNLVDSAEFYDDDVVLVICGAGSLEEYIKKRSEKLHNIRYLGLVDRQKSMQIQAEATILTNPRQPGNEFTKYSFPSKNLEYMIWGKPVVVFKLEGMPDEYDDYLIYYKGNSPQEMADTINTLCAKSESERESIGAKSAMFVTTEKNNDIQSKKILKLFLK